MLVAGKCYIAIEKGKKYGHFALVYTLFYIFRYYNIDKLAKPKVPTCQLVALNIEEIHRPLILTSCFPHHNIFSQEIYTTLLIKPQWRDDDHMNLSNKLKQWQNMSSRYWYETHWNISQALACLYTRKMWRRAWNSHVHVHCARAYNVTTVWEYKYLRLCHVCIDLICASNHRRYSSHACFPHRSRACSVKTEWHFGPTSLWGGRERELGCKLDLDILWVGSIIDKIKGYK